MAQRLIFPLLLATSIGCDGHHASKQSSRSADDAVTHAETSTDPSNPTPAPSTLPPGATPQTESTDQAQATGDTKPPYTGPYQGTWVHSDALNPATSGGANYRNSFLQLNRDLTIAVWETETASVPGASDAFAPANAKVSAYSAAQSDKEHWSITIFASASGGSGGSGAIVLTNPDKKMADAMTLAPSASMFSGSEAASYKALATPAAWDSSGCSQAEPPAAGMKCMNLRCNNQMDMYVWVTSQTKRPECLPCPEC